MLPQKIGIGVLAEFRFNAIRDIGDILIAEPALMLDARAIFFNELQIDWIFLHFHWRSPLFTEKISALD